MNSYKKLIKNKNTRIKILETMSFFPDAWIIRLQYRMKTGRWPNLKNPQRYTEKIQWYKLNYRKQLLSDCSDKYIVRNYVESKGLGHILNELYAVYDDATEIDFSSLPDSFAMKANNGSGTNVFVSNKNCIDENELRNIAEKWLSHPAKSLAGEWVYENIKPRVIFEKLLDRDSNNDLPDYKFFCFDGEPYCLYVMTDYADNHDNGQLGFFDMDFHQLNAFRQDFAPLDKSIEKPKHFEKMVEYAKTLSKDFPHVRVDFYDVDGQIVFGELTFHNASGYTIFNPDEFDFILGEKFVLPNENKMGGVAQQ